MKISKLKNINIVRLLRLNKLKTPVIILLAVAFFIGSNFLLSFVSIRWDLSYGTAYTLSDSTKKILQKLDDNVTIKFYCSSDIPTKVIPLKNNIIDLLNEYRKVNPGKVTIKQLDPKKDSNALKDAQETGVPELRFSQLEQDKYAVTSSYFALVIGYKEKKEILPQLTDIEGLEYNLTASIYKQARKEEIKLGIIGKDMVYDPSGDDISIIRDVMQQQFNIEHIDLSNDSSTLEIDPFYKALLIFDSNKKEFTEKELSAIEKYLNNNGKAIVFADGEWVGDALFVSPAKHNLNPLLEKYGLVLNKDLVLSSNAELVNFGNSTVQFMSTYPFFLRTNSFNSKSTYFSNINQVTMPWVSSISKIKTADWNTNDLILSTGSSWNQKEASGSSFILDPQMIPRPEQKELKEFVLAAESKKKNGGSVTLFGTSRFILNQYLSRTSNNLELVLNILNDYASNGALSGIRQRIVSFYPLPDLSDNQKDLLKYVNILILPTLFGLIGGVVFWKRR